MKTFDVIRSEPGFNRSSLIASSLTEAELGPFLAKVMGTYDQDYRAGKAERKPCSVTVHQHPTFWNTDWVHDCREEAAR